MTERLSRAQQLGRAVEAGWQREDIEAQLARLHDRRQSRARRRALAVPLAALAIVVGGVVALTSHGAPVPAPAPVLVARTAIPPVPPRDVVAPPLPPPPPPPHGPAALTLGDGSVVTPFDKDCGLVARRVSDSEVVVALAGGAARFEVPDHQGRRFEAEVGALALETRGAAFRVRVTGHQAEVSAEHGELTARWGREHRSVKPGETRSFPTIAQAAPPAGPSEALVVPSAADRTWRDDAARGDFTAAWTARQAADAPLDGPAGPPPPGG